ncbi:MAG: polyphosphate--glucose phosphotransferase [Opitutus sp.]
MKVLGIDIGGSALKGAPVDVRTGQLTAERCKVETPTVWTPAEMAEGVRQIVAHFKWRGRIGIGFPGVVHGPLTMTSSNLHKKFIGLNTERLFAKAAGCPVTLVNDADAAGIAEMRFGAGRGVDGTVLLLTLGTGVGSALFYRGVLFPNSELGHLPLRGRSAERFVSSAARKRRGLSWHKWGTELGAYLRILETLLSPQLIIIGGGVSAKSDKFFKYAKCRAPKVPAAAYNAAGIVGAALWAVDQKRYAHARGAL